MKLKIEVLSEPDKNWDKRVEENNGTIYQSTTYARFQEECLGMKTLYLLVKKNSEIVAQLMITYGPRFAKYLRQFNTIYNIASKFFRVYTFIRGPIIINKQMKKEAYKIIISYLDNLAKKEKTLMIIDVSLPIEEDSSIYNLFYKRGFYSDAWGTVLINTTKSKETLWKEVSRSHRRSIRKGQNQNLIVKEAKTKEEFDKVISIIKEMSKRNKIFSHSKEYYHKLFAILKEKNNGKVLYIEKNGKGIATITLYLFGKKVTQTMIAHSEYSVEKSIYGVDFLEWYIINWAHENGYESYDLAGIRPKSQSEKDKGLFHYKSTWGGNILEYPYFSKVYSSQKYKFIQKLMKIKKWLVRMPGD